MNRVLDFQNSTSMFSQMKMAIESKSYLPWAPSQVPSFEIAYPSGFIDGKM